MEAIKNWAFSISTAAVVTAIIQMLVPKGNLGKILKITLSVFFLSILFSPILLDADFELKTNDSFDFKIDEYAQDLEFEMSKMIESQLSLQVKQLVVSKLSEIGVETLEVDIIVKAENINSAVIQSVEVRLSEKYKIRDTEIRYQIKTIVDCQIVVLYMSG